MKKLRLSLVFILASCLAFAMLACVRKVQPKLDTPQNLVVEEGILTWDEVENADGYKIKYSDGTTSKVKDNGELTIFGFDNLSSGTYIFAVMAYGANHRDSDWSQPKSYVWSEPDDETPATTLDTPINLRVEDDILLWDEVDNADGYHIKIGDGLPFWGALNHYDLSALDSGTYTFRVLAVGDGDLYLNSAWSAPLVHEWEKPAGQPEPPEPEKAPLNIPTNLTINGGILSWDEVDNADGYKISANGSIFNRGANNFDLSLLDDGYYVLKVMARANSTASYSDSAWSGEITDTVMQ